MTDTKWCVDFVAPKWDSQIDKLDRASLWKCDRNRVSCTCVYDSRK